MAKRKAKDVKEEGAAVALAEPASPMTPEEMEAVRKELADARKRIRALERRNKAIIDAEKAVDLWKRELDDLTASLNETRKSWKQAVERLQVEIKRNERQGELEFEERSAAATTPPGAPQEPAAPPVDTAASTKLSDVAGLTESLREKLASIDVTTVGECEAAMREGKLVPNRVKGLGETSINKITDALRVFREKHPVEVDSRPKRCRCGAEYPGELTACPTCEGTFYERIEPEAPTPAVETALAEKAAVDEGVAGTVLDPATRAA